MALTTPLLEMIIGRSAASERVFEYFLERQGHSPETAIPFTPSGDRQRRQFDTLRQQGVIVPAGGKRYYLDRPAFDAMRARERRVRGAAVVAVAALAVAGVVAVTQP